MKSPKDSFGFFGRVSKKDKIESLETKIKTCKEEIEVGEKLLAIVTQVVYKEEIHFIRKRQIERFNEFINEFH